MSTSRRLIAALGGLVAVILIGLAVVAFTGGFDTTTRTRASGTGTQVVRVALVDRTVGFDVTPDVIEVASGTPVILEVVNEADDVHDLAVEGGLRTAMLGPGDIERIDLGVVTNDFDGHCTIDGHDIAGMTVDIRVV